MPRPATAGGSTASFRNDHFDALNEGLDMSAPSAEAIGEYVADPEARAALAGPFTLHRKIHARPPDEREPAAVLAARGPIGDDLVPALRAFLEARRCCPVLALPHAVVGGLDFLMERGEPAEVYLRRSARHIGDRQIDGAGDVHARERLGREHVNERDFSGAQRTAELLARHRER